jgi:site-specific DNA recombinase
MGEPWGVYCRISRVRDGSTLGVDRQEPPCRALVERLGGEVAEVYIDNDLSAFSGKARPDFSRMLDDLKAGRIVGVAAWQADRFVRTMREALPLLDVVRAVGGKIATVAGPIDLATAQGRSTFRGMADRAELEADLTSERMALKHLELAEAGRHHGGPRAFGYQRDGMTVIEAEAGRVREAAGRLLAGETVGTILRDWQAQGVMTPRGNRWVATSFRNMLCSPRLAGLRVHQDQVVGEAAWPPILDRVTWEQVCAVFADHVGRRHQGRGRIYLLTGGLAVCGYEECGRPLYAGLNRVQSYRCQVDRGGCGRISVRREHLEDEVTGRLLAALAGPKLAQLRARAASGDGQAAQLAAAKRSAEVDLEQLAALHGRGELQAVEWMAARRPILARIEAADRGLAHQPRVAALADLPETRAALEEAWRGWTVDRRRVVVQAVIRQVQVGPARPGGRFDPDRVHCDWLA